MTKDNGLAHRPWIGFDTETTGVSPQKDRIVTAATVRRSPSGIIPASADEEVRTWLANPGIPIPPSAANIHGISTEHAALHGRSPSQVVEEVTTNLFEGLNGGGTIVVFNAGFDLPLLETEAKRTGVESLGERVSGGFVRVADPLVLDRALDRYRKGKRTLSDLANVYGVDVPADTHQAHVDALLTLDLLAAMVARYPTLKQMGAEELHEFQMEAHREWAVNFQAFMRSKGREVNIDPNWF